MGYTLVELLIAVVIIGVLSAISVSYISEIWKGQEIISNLENMRAWLEAVRRAAVRGQSCQVLITTANLKDGQTVLESNVFGGTSTIGSTPCYTPIMSRDPSNPRIMSLESPYQKERYILSVKSGSADVGSFVFTPRGTVFNSSATPSFTQDIVFDLAISNSSYKKNSQSYCLRMSGFLGTVKSIGAKAC
jgi:prepilin-type N-terminal cleavage/methylation domain-containing protein